MTALSTEVERGAEPYFDRYAYPDWLRHHSRLVGRVAALLALAREGEVDARAVALPAYLHDIGRSPLLADAAGEHNELAALVLAAEGLPACVEPARRHPVYAVLDPAIAPRTLAERIVYVADRRAGLAVVSLEERSADIARRHPRFAEEIARSTPLALALEREVFAGLPFSPAELAERVEAQWPS